MAKAKKPKLYKRQWLNSDKGTAYVIIDAEICEIDYGKQKGGTEASISLEIKDCNRQASLEFWYYGQKEYQRRLKKIAILKEMVTELEAFMLANPPTLPPAKEKVKKKAPEKPVKLASELLLTERHPDPPSLSGEVMEALRKPRIIDVGPVIMTPATIARKTRRTPYRK